MNEFAAIFPGQGSQSVGMGRELYEASPIVQETFAEADEILRFPLSKLCFEGPDAELTKTVNTQPALLTASVATLRLLQAEGYRPKAAAGHSLGEYSALVAAGAIDFPDALRTVRLRGELMEAAVPSGEGTMGAILGLADADVQAICSEVEGVVEPATYNAPGQVVVAGSVSAVDEALALAKERGARRTQRLNVSGPFHSSLLQEAAERLGEWLDRITIETPAIPVYANVTAAPVRDPMEIRANLSAQVSSPVRWVECVQSMMAAGIDSFVELGPGRVLCGLVRRIDKGATLANVESVETWHAFVGRGGNA